MRIVMPQQIIQAVTLVFLAAASFQDMRSRTISLRLAGVWIIIGCAVTALLLIRGELGLFPALLSVLPGVFLLGMSLISGGRIGIGDGVMFVAMGLCVGAEKAFFLLGLSTFGAAAFGAAGLALAKLKKGARLPFLPFVLSAYVTSLILPL